MMASRRFTVVNLRLVQRCDTVETVEVQAPAVPAGVGAIKAAIEKSPHADVTIRILKRHRPRHHDPR